MTTFFSAYGSDSNEMTFAFKGGETVTIELVGYGTATIDWGDGSKKKTYELKEERNSYSWKYSQTSPRTIKITGKNITELYCSEIGLTNLDVSRSPALRILKCNDNQLTSLDVSKNFALVELNCTNNQLTSLDVSNNLVMAELFCGRNQLTNLDVSKNTALTKYLSVYRNQLSTESLNDLFIALPYGNCGTIFMMGNPGTNTCNQSIAKEKGWRVVDSDEGWEKDFDED
jgi:Leucine-rich repeat (LRR) protein